MLDRELIRREPDAVRAGIQRKFLDASLVDQFLATDAAWRHSTTELEKNQAELNRVSKSIGALIGQGKKEEAEAAKGETRSLKEAIAAEEQKTRELEANLRSIELQFPNLPHSSVPNGKDETENPVVRVWGEKPEFAELPKPHWEVGESLKLEDALPCSEYDEVL